MAYENITSIQKKELGLSAAKARIVAVRPICASAAGRPGCMAYGSNVTVEVTLNGCLDSLGGYYSSFNVVDYKGTISFGAVNIPNIASQTARCSQANKKLINMTVPFEGDISLQNMDFTGTF